VRLALGSYEGAVHSATDALTSARATERIFAHDATFWSGNEERQRSVANRLGWLDVASTMRGHVAELRDFAERVRSDGFADAVLLGMGGSSLAPDVLRRSFGARPGWPRLHVLDTTDPATINGVVRAIDPARTLVFVSSKSGTTLEPNCLFGYFFDLVRKAKGDSAGDSFVAVTDPGTPLADLTRVHGFRQMFENPPDIGGRYSALSYFGLAPAAAIGIDVARLLDRGIAAASVARAGGEALELGAALGALAVVGRNKVTFVVAPPVDLFGLWVEQLIAESTGKLGRGIVPIAGEPPGTIDRYGADRVFVQLRVAGSTPPEHDALIAAAIGAGHPAIVIDLADAFDLGSEFFRWEFAIAVAGQVLGINPFDEPNVQESKDNTNRMLREFEASGQLDVAGVDGAPQPVVFDAPGHVSDQPLDQAVSGLLERLRAGDYFAITAYVPSTEATDAAFGDMRGVVRDATAAATTLGYGPRFLHSTGQLHKGGPATGLFVQLVDDTGDELSIPGQPFGFGKLIRAQAAGDFASLEERGRRVIRVRLEEV